MVKRVYSLLLACILVLSSVVSVHAGFGISPSDITNDRLIPGDRYEKEFIISRSDPFEPLRATIEVDSPEVESWLSFEPGLEFILPEGENRVPFTVIVTVPEDAPLGTFEGAFRVIGNSLEEQAAGVTLVKGARVDVVFATTDIEVTELTVRSLEVLDTENADNLQLAMKIENKGNTQSAPDDVVLEVFNLLNESVATVSAQPDGVVQPGEISDLVVSFDTDLDAGEYFGEATVYLAGTALREEKLFFRILQPSLTDTRKQSADALQIGYLRQLFSDDTSALSLAAIALGVAIIAGVFVVVSLFLWKINPKLRQKLWWKIDVIVLLVVMILALLVVASEMRREQMRLVVDQNIINKLEETSILGVEDEQAGAVGQDNGSIQGAATDDPRTGVRVEEAVEPFHVRGTETLGIYFVYSSPSMNADIVTQVSEGTRLPTINENKEWYQVIIPGTDDTGWIKKAHIQSAQ